MDRSGLGCARDGDLGTRRRTRRIRAPLRSGSQYLSIRYTERLAEASEVTSVGSKGNSYDSALAETIIGLYKRKLVRQRDPWKEIDDVEHGTREYVDWFNHRRLLEPIGYFSPAELEEAYRREQDPSNADGPTDQSLHGTPDASEKLSL